MYLNLTAYDMWTGRADVRLCSRKSASGRNKTNCSFKDVHHQASVSQRFQVVPYHRLFQHGEAYGGVAVPGIRLPSMQEKKVTMREL